MILDAELEEGRRRHHAVAESSDSDASEEARDELASSHSSDDDYDVQNARGGWSNTSARPPDSRQYLRHLAVFFPACI